jgi:hypothetical protein
MGWEESQYNRIPVYDAIRPRGEIKVTRRGTMGSSHSMCAVVLKDCQCDKSLCLHAAARVA